MGMATEDARGTFHLQGTAGGSCAQKRASLCAPSVDNQADLATDGMSDEGQVRGRAGRSRRGKPRGTPATLGTERKTRLGWGLFEDKERRDECGIRQREVEKRQDVSTGQDRAQVKCVEAWAVRI